MKDLTTKTTEHIYETILGRKFMSSVDAATALYVANVLENYAKKFEKAK